MIGLLSKYLLPIVAAIGLAGWLGAGVQTYRLKSLQADVKSANAEALEKAREREQEWSLIVRNINEANQSEKDRIASERDALAASLRNRPERRMPATSACSGDGSGSTGAQLSRPDGEFLARLAASADRTAADLRACQAWAAEVTKK